MQNPENMPMYGFVFTLNNYTPANDLALRGAVGHCGIKYISFGREVGAQGTPHLQGYLQTNQKHKDRIHKKFSIFVVPQERSATQARDYTQKEGDFFEAGTFDASIQGTKEKKQGGRSDLDELQRAINQGDDYNKICDEHFSSAAKYSKFIQERIRARDTNKELDSLREALASSSLRPWQQALKDVVETEINPRVIHWIWEAQGNTGKSWMTKYLAAMHNACVMTPGKKGDMAYLYSKNPSKVVVFDLSRTLAPGDEKNWTMDAVYSLAEDLKNGMVTSYKYDSANVLTTGCHVIFFANFSPDLSKWSADRYNIIQL